METKVLEQEKKPYNPADYKRASIDEYRYKYTNHKRAAKILYNIGKYSWRILSVALVVLSVIMLYYAVIIIAIQSVNASESTTEFTGFTFANYANMFGKRIVNESILNTFKTSIIATAIATVLGTIVAVGIHYLPPKAKSVLMLFNNIPLLNADIVTGISLMLIFSLFLPMNRHIFGFGTILIAHIYFIFPYIILSVVPKMKEIDPNLLDASLDLGVRPVKSVGKVIIPAIKGGIFSGMVLAFTISFEDFVVGYFTTGNGYNTLSIWLYTAIGRKQLFPGVYAFSTALTLFMIIAIIAYNLLKNRIVDIKAKREIKKAMGGNK